MNGRNASCDHSSYGGGQINAIELETRKDPQRLMLVVAPKNASTNPYGLIDTPEKHGATPRLRH